MPERRRPIRAVLSTSPHLRTRVVLVEFAGVVDWARWRVGAEDDDAVVVGALAQIDIAVRQHRDGALADQDHHLAAARDALPDPGLEIGIERLLAPRIRARRVDRHFHVHIARLRPHREFGPRGLPLFAKHVALQPGADERAALCRPRLVDSTAAAARAVLAPDAGRLFEFLYAHHLAAHRAFAAFARRGAARHAARH